MQINRDERMEKRMTEKIYGLHLMGNIQREGVHKKSTEKYRDDKRNIKYEARRGRLQSQGM
jgi:hypothetical protein